MKTRQYAGYEYEELGIPEMFEQLLPRVRAGQTVLDLGTGAGHPTAPLAFAGLQITGVDMDNFSLEECNQLYAKAGLEGKMKTVWADALEYLQANTDKFDVVTMFDILMFLTKTDGKEVMRLAYEAMAPSGYMWIATMSTNDERFLGYQGCLELIDSETYLAHSHCHGASPMCFYFPMEIENYLKEFGAEIVFQTETENSCGVIINVILAQKPG